jgi:hypothetical protein
MSRTPCLAPLLFCLAALLAGCETVPAGTAAPQAPVTEVAPPAQPAAPPETTVPAQTPAPEPVPEPPVEVKKPEPEPAPAPILVCPPPPKPQPTSPQRPPSVLPVLGDVENVVIEPPGLRLEARLDTGIAGSQIDARGIHEFERDGKPWVKFLLPGPSPETPVEVSRPVVRTTAPKQAGGAKRYVVSLRTTLGRIDQFTEFTLADRSAQAHPVVLGRNFLRDQALVDVARRFTVPTPKP